MRSVEQTRAMNFLMMAAAMDPSLAERVRGGMPLTDITRIKVPHPQTRERERRLRQKAAREAKRKRSQ